MNTYSVCMEILLSTLGYPKALESLGLFHDYPKPQPPHTGSSFRVNRSPPGLLFMALLFFQVVQTFPIRLTWLRFWRWESRQVPIFELSSKTLPISSFPGFFPCIRHGCNHSWVPHSSSGGCARAPGMGFQEGRERTNFRIVVATVYWTYTWYRATRKICLLPVAEVLNPSENAVLILSDRLKSKDNLSMPIFTVDLLVAKFYIVNSIPLISLIQRNAKSIGFEHFHILAVKRGVGIRGPGLHLLEETRNGGAGLDSKLNHSMESLMVGPNLNRMNHLMLQSLIVGIESLEGMEGSTIDLYKWCQDT